MGGAPQNGWVGANFFPHSIQCLSILKPHSIQFRCKKFAVFGNLLVRTHCAGSQRVSQLVSVQCVQLCAGFVDKDDRGNLLALHAYQIWHFGGLFALRVDYLHSMYVQAGFLYHLLCCPPRVSSYATAQKLLTVQCAHSLFDGKAKTQSEPIRIHGFTLSTKPAHTCTHCTLTS
jgi:hypothetical protein